MTEVTTDFYPQTLPASPRTETAPTTVAAPDGPGGAEPLTAAVGIMRTDANVFVATSSASPLSRAAAVSHFSLCEDHTTIITFGAISQSNLGRQDGDARETERHGKKRGGAALQSTDTQM